MVHIHPSRKQVLQEEFEKPYFTEIKKKLLERKKRGEVIYPPGSLIFHAFDLTPFEDVKVVILGQDPYHGPGQAHGLAFSVPDGVALPPSLQNIFKEMQVSPSLGTYDIDMKDKNTPRSGNLEYLAKQGVLLLNAILTVTAHKPASHHDIGRQQFTDAVIQKISDLKEGVISLLRGNFARQKKSLIDTSKHIVLETTHPSPFSAHKGFLGSGCFQQTNELLLMQGEEAIEWIK